MTILKLYSGNNQSNKTLGDLYRFSDVLRDNYDNDQALYNRCTTPRVNIFEEKENYVISLAAPGLKKTDISISVEDNILSISHRSDDEKEEVYYSSREFNYNNFERAFRVPKTVNTDKIKADYKAGVLTVTLPKRDEAIERGPKEIKIS